MFIIGLEQMCSKEQQDKWLLKAKKCQMMGCYAQTELGHGSNVAGLGTTAKFDPKTDEFIINTPNIESSKWWPGDLGNFSTHAIVYAQLIIDDNFYGVAPFMVQIRSR